MKRGGASRRTWIPLIPSAVAILLAVPTFGFAFFFDDYDFLARAQTLRLRDLLPDPQVLFYRPVSREVYFSLVNALGPAALVGAHVLNALLFGTAVLLLVLIVHTLAGSRAGLVAGLCLAALGQAPLLVGWASGSQDLLAMVFLLGALYLRLTNRRTAAVGMMALAILSKETAIAFVPILLGMDWILGRKREVVRGELPAYGALLLIWVWAHPGLRMLLRKPRSGAPSYVGLGQAGSIASFGKTAGTALNLPLTGLSTPWPAHLGGAAVAASAIAVLAIFLDARRGRHSGAKEMPSARRAGALGVAMFALPALFLSFVVRDWLPYYACIPALGVCLLLGLALRKNRWAAASGVACFIVLGVWCRGMALDPTVTVERNLANAGVALRRVEESFKRLWPSLPSRANVYVSAQVIGTQSVHVHMRRFQALRVWYRDPTILTLDPSIHVASRGRDLLCWISPTLDVFEIDPRSLEPRSSGPPPQLSEYKTTLREYARGLSGAGETDQAVGILVRLPEGDEIHRSYDYRQAAMLLFERGRDSEAVDLLSKASPIDSVEASPIVADLLLDSSPGTNRDESVLRAFGVRGPRAEVYRRYMRFFASYNFPDPARAFANKLQAVAPGDPESAALLGRLGPGGPVDRITTPVDGARRP